MAVESMFIPVSPEKADRIVRIVSAEKPGFRFFVIPAEGGSVIAALPEQRPSSERSVLRPSRLFWRRAKSSAKPLFARISRDMASA